MVRHGTPTFLLILVATMSFPAIVPASPEPGPSGTISRAGLPAPQLISPANDSWVTRWPLVLCWTFPFGSIPANEVCFFLQVDNSPDFQTPEIDSSMEGETSLAPGAMLNNEGTYYWRVGVKHNSTEGPWSETWRFSADRRSPDIFSCRLVSNHGYTSERNVTLVIKARDFSGVEGFRYSFDNQNWTEWMPFAENISLELGAVDGKYRLYVQLRDRFNNWCNAWQSPTVVLDTILPTGNITINNDSLYTTSPYVKLGLDANDTNGVKNMSLSASADFHDAPWLPYDTSFDWNLTPEEGWHTIYAKFRDPGGLESLTASASIYFDDKLPSGSFTVNSGATYSRSGDVTLEINATDNVGLDSMMISVSPAMTGTSWIPYSRTAVFRLPGGDGPKTVHLRLKDLAGNICEVAPVSIILDTTAPSATVLPLEPLSSNTSFKVRWAGVDRTSGIASFDVDYSVDTVDWTPWISGSMEQGALFSGSDGSIYFFRARARDLAGNTGDYFVGPESSVEVEVPPPVVEIRWPAPGAQLSGMISVAGSSGTPAAERSIRRIELRIDNGTWSVANGTLSWDYLLDTSNLRPGVHLVEVRAFDGTEYSTTASRSFHTTRKAAEISAGSSSPPVNLLAALALVLAILTAVVLSLRKR